MKKVGIITILKVNNYGAELQAYATQKIMNRIGYDAEIIDYLYYRNIKHIKERCSLPFYPYPLKYRLKEWGLRAKDYLERLYKTSVYTKRESRFNEFHNRFNRFSLKQYRKYSELFENPPIYDAYCVGSDQVWNPRCYTNLSAYFLKFAPSNAIKFSYASSFGVKELPKNAKLQYKECINGLSHISVRENTGIDIVKNLVGREAKLVADPTLLLSKNDWKEVEQPLENIPQAYVLVYELHPIAMIMALAKEIANRNNLKIVRICKDSNSKSDNADVIYVKDAGPSEFVYLFNNADAVVTNSFHGTAFSINFNKNFYCVLSLKQSNNSRQINLLNKCGLMDRIVYDSDGMPQLDNISIDFTKANEALDMLRTDSINYIKTAIDGDK